MSSESVPPREFLRHVESDPDEVSRRYPNARDITIGGLFISHAGRDSRRIQDDIVSPVVYRRLPADGYFLHSRMSGGAEDYRELVRAALHWCDKFMLILSKNSLSNVWVHAEVEWALERSRPMLIASLDDSTWGDFARRLQLPEGLLLQEPTEIFDFGVDPDVAARQLGTALDALLERLPRRGRYSRSGVKMPD